MLVGVIGINHKSAELTTREAFSKACSKHFQSPFEHNFPYVLLSTCNRSEIYFSSLDLAETHSYLLNVIRRDFDPDLEHKIYSYFGIDCFFHLASVTTGMDSAMIGESEIQGQVKHSYENAHSSRPLCRELHFLFQKSLKIGKEIRSRSLLYHDMPTIEEAIFNTASHILKDLQLRNILLVGCSEINIKILKYFKKKELKRITFCNRTQEKIEKIVSDEEVALLDWQELHRWHEYDLIIFGTKSPHYLLNSLEPLTSRKVIIDLSVPRNVNPKLRKHPLVTLINVDQLSQTIDKKRKIKGEMIVRIERQFIAQSIEKLSLLFEAKDHLRLIEAS